MTTSERMPGPADAVAREQVQFLSDIGAPALSFALPIPDDGEVVIPTGVTPCCRVIHQIVCPSYIAKSVVCGFFTVRLDGLVREDNLVFDRRGDVLASPGQFAASITAMNAMVKAKAARLGGSVTQAMLHIWSLSVDQTVRWNTLGEERSALEIQELQARATLNAADIGRLPILGPPEFDDESVVTEAEAISVWLSDLTARPGWIPLGAYPEGTLEVPGELGHDGQARYTLDLLIPELPGEQLRIAGYTDPIEPEGA